MKKLNAAGYTELNRVRRELEEAQAEIDDQEDTISEAEDLIKQHWTDLQTAQAEIDELKELNRIYFEIASEYLGEDEVRFRCEGILRQRALEK